MKSWPELPAAGGARGVPDFPIPARNSGGFGFLNRIWAMQDIPRPEQDGFIGREEKRKVLRVRMEGRK